ncbi:hypothetical protein J3R30DRAFT_3404855 [Lentinula aciculospora]|uniref:Uncharacterized protein n=1 Tax=Lentinula aciculospora TaxID=153920 RepID=A0A9W9A9F2_9AGAR|nr:hypothetical protein J3R30DRAFT_3404855 [Lentinula aciculospora]
MARLMRILYADERNQSPFLCVKRSDPLRERTFPVEKWTAGTLSRLFPRVYLPIFQSATTMVVALPIEMVEVILNELANSKPTLHAYSHTRDADWILNSWSKSTFLHLPLAAKITLRELEIGLIPDHNIFDVLYHRDSPFNWTSLQKIVFYRIWDNGLIQGFLNGRLPALKCLELKKTEKMYHFASSGAFTGVIQNPSILCNLTELSVAFAFNADDFQFLENVINEVQKNSRLSSINLILPINLDGLEIEKAEYSTRFHRGFTVILELASSPSVKWVHLIVPIGEGVLQRRKLGIRDFMSTHFPCDTCTIQHILVVYRQAVITREPFSEL